MEEKGQYITLLPPSQAALELRKHSPYKKLNAHQVRILYLLHEKPARWDELKRQVDYFEMGNLIQWGLVLGTRASGEVLKLTEEAIGLLVQFCGLSIKLDTEATAQETQP